jgi:hypothetical protein
MADHAVVQQAKAKNLHLILSKPNVVGVGTGYRQRQGMRTDELCVVALVRQKVPRAGLATGALVPDVVDGVPTDVLQVGEVRALKARTERWRPAPGGVSVGHYQVTAGTLGAVVRARADGARLILSNNHVLANSNAAQVGDAILQPGAVDGGREPADVIARLERFVPIQFNVQPATCGLALTAARFLNFLASLFGSHHRFEVTRQDPQATNQVDAAVARPVDDSQVSDEILGIGTVSGTAPATLGMRVRKSGRTTEVTYGEITVLDATITVGYGDSEARFDGQLVAGAMSKPGDSGSLLVAADSQQAVGLLFAGSDQTTIFNPIQAVLDGLQVSL